VIYVLCVAGGLVVGGALAWALVAARAHAAQVEASGLQGKLDELRGQVQQAAADFGGLRAQLEQEQRARVAAETSQQETTLRLAEEKQLLDDARGKLTDAFKAVAGDTLSTNTEAFLLLAKETLGTILEGAKGDLGQRQEAIKGLVSPLTESLRQFDERVQGLEKNRQEAYAGLTEQVRALSSTQQQLQKETGNLVNALRAPQTVGSWGEITLERVVEFAGMSEHCDFTREMSVETEEGRLRPDLIVHLPGGREIVVDAKSTFNAYYEAVTAESPEVCGQRLSDHANYVRRHMTGLSAKNYSQQFDRAPDFVVMFLPVESAFAAALDTDRGLFDDALKRGVLLASPTTLIALLRSVALTWRQEQIAENAQAISDLGKQLYERMRTLAEHLTDVGTGLGRANVAFNRAVGSLEARVLPTARRFKELGAATGDEIPLLAPIEVAPRALIAPDLADNPEGQ
jgi:DNA recombination protein RmuC